MIDEKRPGIDDPMLADGHWQLANFRQRMSRKALKELVRQGRDSPIIRGHICCVKWKHVGFGVYDVWCEPQDRKA